MAGWEWHEYVPVARTRVHAAGLGPAAAPTVVCVHGLGGSHRYYLPLARQLGSEFQVVALDLPGFGATRGPARALDARDTGAVLGRWLRATGRTGSILVGDSTGCQAIAAMAMTDPGLLGPVVLAGPTFDRQARSAPRQAWRLIANGLVDPTGVAMVPIRLRDRYDSGVRRWLATFRLFLTDPVERKLPWLLPPTAVVRGERDPLSPRQWTEELVDGLPDGRLVTIPRAGHTVNFVAPGALAAVVRQLAAEHRVGQERLREHPPVDQQVRDYQVAPGTEEDRGG